MGGSRTGSVLRQQLGDWGQERGGGWGRGGSGVLWAWDDVTIICVHPLSPLMSLSPLIPALGFAGACGPYDALPCAEDVLPPIVRVIT